MMWKIQKKIVKWCGKYGRKIIGIVKWFGKYGRQVSWIMKWYGKYGRQKRKDMKSTEETQVD